MATLTRRQPFGELADIHHRLDRVFERITDGERTSFMPALDVIRKEDRIVIKADMPGLEPDEVKIRVQNGILAISGRHEEEKEEREEHYVRRERSYGSFSRSLALPEGVNPEAIEATAKDGVVEVTVPLPEAQQKRAIEITPKASA